MTVISEMPFAPPLEVTLVIPPPFVSATVFSTNARCAPLIVLPLPPRVPPVNVTMSAVPLPLIVTLVRLRAPVNDAVVPSIALPLPPLTLMLGLAAPTLTLIVPPPLISMPGCVPVPVARKPASVIVPPVSPLAVNAGAVLAKFTVAFEIVMFALLLLVTLMPLAAVLCVRFPDAAGACVMFSVPGELSLSIAIN